MEHGGSRMLKVKEIRMDYERELCGTDLSFFLFFQKLLLAADITAITLG